MPAQSAHEVISSNSAGNFFRLLGALVIGFSRQLGAVTVLSVNTIRAMFKYSWDWNSIIRHCYLIGNRSLTIVLLTGLFTGMVLSLQFSVGLGRFGLKLYTGQIVGLSLARELGPVLTALMVAARVGSGIAAEIGSMMVTEQVLAIEAMGANPIHKLVMPRTIAIMITLPLLAVLSEMVGILGGMFITVREADVTASFFLDQIWSAVGFDDFIHGIAKTLFFAFVIVMISCHQGLTTYGGTQGVGRSTTRAVVYSSIVIFVVDFFLTKLLIIM